MITGDDTDLLAPGVPGQHVANFLNQFVNHWPEMRVLVGHGDAWWRPNEGAETGGDDDRDLPWGEEPQALSSLQGGVVVARDTAMMTFLDENGYELDPSGEGPFQILYQPCQRGVLRVKMEEDPNGNDEYGNFEPYEVRLHTSGLSFLTAITPDVSSSFSQKLLRRLSSTIEGAEKGSHVP